MPFPFISAIYALPNSGNIYSESFVEVFGSVGIIYALVAHFAIQVLAFGGSFLYGRRVFCSGICTYAGHFAEAFGSGMPANRFRNSLNPNSKHTNRTFQVVAQVLLIIDFGIGFFAAVLLIFWLITRSTVIPIELILDIEIMRVLTLDTIVFGVGFLFFGGRFYCYYCPAGLSVGWIARLGGQQIDSNLTSCTLCGKCNDVCKMSIDVMASASRGEPIATWRCVGCDMCVIACPTNNLKFSTNFTRTIKSKFKH